MRILKAENGGTGKLEERLDCLTLSQAELYGTFCHALRCRHFFMPLLMANRSFLVYMLCYFNWEIEGLPFFYLLGWNTCLDFITVYGKKIFTTKYVTTAGHA